MEKSTINTVGIVFVEVLQYESTRVLLVRYSCNNELSSVAPIGWELHWLNGHCSCVALTPVECVMYLVCS